MSNRNTKFAVVLLILYVTKTILNRVKNDLKWYIVDCFYLKCFKIEINQI